MGISGTMEKALWKRGSSPKPVLSIPTDFDYELNIFESDALKSIWHTDKLTADDILVIEVMKAGTAKIMD